MSQQTPPVGKVSFRDGGWILDETAARIADAQVLQESPVVGAFLEGEAESLSAWLVTGGLLTEVRLWRTGSAQAEGFLIQFAGLPAPAQGMVHELHNALSVARAAAELGRAAPAASLQRSLDRALAILERSRGEFTVPAARELVPVSLDDVVRAVVAEVSLRFPDQRVVAQVEPVSAAVDATVIEQIVVNLALNAARHGQPPVVVHAYRTETAAVVAVSDAGTGIDASLFAAGAVSAASAGSGLGLPVVSVLAQQNGLDLSWERGRVELHVPLVDASQELTPPDQPA